MKSSSLYAFAIGALLTMFLTLAVMAVGNAASVGLRWDPNDPAPEGYRVFVAEEAVPFDYAAPAWQGPETTCAIGGLSEGATYRFVVRAYEGSLESADSDMVVYPVPVPVETIYYPKQPRSILIQFGSD